MTEMKVKDISRSLCTKCGLFLFTGEAKCPDCGEVKEWPAK